MLAGQRHLALNDNIVATTPLLIPSFSSKGFPDIKKRVAITEEVITDAALFSAYDIFYHHIDTPITFPELIYLDSGGYEATKDDEFSDLGYTIHEPKPWNEYFYRSVLETWPTEIPTIFVSFDHPNNRYPITVQIEKTHDLFNEKKNILKTILIKPEREGEKYIDIEAVINNLNLLTWVDVIGITEKELGNSTLKRMVNIAKLRIAINDIGLKIPIHIFGSLDTLSAPLYFISGADIFDGLTWQRLGYSNGRTLYLRNYYSLEFGNNEEDERIEAHTWFKNVYYLNGLKIEMQKFIKYNDFNYFKNIGSYLADSYRNLQTYIQEV